MPPRISVTIIARDEAERIGAALASVAWADEVLVLDSGSDDGTPELARAAGARVELVDWPGYGAQKNRAADLARLDWVLSLDADERVDPELARAISRLPVEPRPAAFRLRRRNHVGGRPIRRWPWSWDRCLRLYDRRRARFTEVAVHESLAVDGDVGSLGGLLEHFGYRDLDDVRARSEQYALLGAVAARARGRRPRPGDALLRPAGTFLRHFLVRGYLLGGRRGLELALAAARGTRLREQVLAARHAAGPGVDG